MHRAREFSCFLVWHRLMGTHVGCYLFTGLSGLNMPFQNAARIIWLQLRFDP